MKAIEAKRYTRSSLPFDQHLKVKLEAGSINNDGYYHLLRYLDNAKVKPDPLVELFYHETDKTERLWVWKTKEGKLPKRIAKAYHKAQIKLDAKVVTELGNLAKRYSVTQSEYLVDFSERIDWEDGDFGDDGSCFWGDRSEALNLITTNGGFAMRFWGENEGELYGAGRCWIIPQNDLLFMFNAYGDLPLSQMALILGHLLEKPFSHVELANKSHTTGLLYINSGRGYVIGESDLQEWDLKIDANCFVCFYCNGTIYEEPAAHTRDRNGDTHPLCESCYDENYRRCERCGEIELDSRFEFVHDVQEHWCRHCIREYTSTCDLCDNHVYDGMACVTVETTGAMIVVCEDCRKHTFYCVVCDKTYYHRREQPFTIYCEYHLQFPAVCDILPA